MDAVAAVRAALVADAALLSLVPATRIFAGPAKLGTTLPFVMLKSVSTDDRNIPAPGTTRFVTERVQVDAVGVNYPQQKAILRAVRHAAADRLNLPASGLSGVVIHTEGGGPDFYSDDYSGWRGSQDFRVDYTETR